MDRQTISAKKRIRWINMTHLIKQYSEKVTDRGDYSIYKYLGSPDYHVRHVDEWSFPSIKKIIELRRITQPLKSYAILNDQGLVGTSTLLPVKNDQVQMLNFNILPSYRNKGYGKIFLQEIQELCRTEGIKSIFCKSRTYWNHYEHWDALLTSENWKSIHTDMYYVIIDKPHLILESKWYKSAKKDSPFSFHSLDSLEISNLANRYSEMKWTYTIPPGLNPLQLMDRLDMEGSVLVKKNDTIVGWMISHKLKHDVWQATSLYVIPEERGAGLTLLAESFYRHKNRGKIHFMVRPENRKMLLFVQRYLVPNEARIYKKKQFQKLLN